MKETLTKITNKVLTREQCYRLVYRLVSEEADLLRRSPDCDNFACLHAPPFADGMKAVAPVR